MSCCRAGSRVPGRPGWPGRPLDRPHGAAVAQAAYRECELAPPLWPWPQVLGCRSPRASAVVAAGSRTGTPLRSVGEVIRERLAPLPAPLAGSSGGGRSPGPRTSSTRPWPAGAACQPGPRRRRSGSGGERRIGYAQRAGRAGGAYRCRVTRGSGTRRRSRLPHRGGERLQALAFAAQRDNRWGQACGPGSPRRPGAARGRATSSPPAPRRPRLKLLGRIDWAAGRLGELPDDIEHARTRCPGLVTLR